MADVVTVIQDNRVVVEVAGADAAAAIATAAVAEMAAQVAADLLEIQEIASGAPDAPSILNKLNKDGDNADVDLLANIGAVSSADLALNSGAGLVGTIQAGTGAVTRPQQDKNHDVVSVNDFGAVGDGVTDATAAINAAILAVANGGGGKIIFGSAASDYYVPGPILLPSNVSVDLNGQTLIGGGPTTGTMFQTATVEAGVLTSNIGQTPDTKIVTATSVFNGRVEECGRVFHFLNFNQGCTIRDVETVDCLQLGRLEHSYYAKLDNVSNQGANDGSTYALHFVDAVNDIDLSSVGLIKDKGFLFEGDCSAVTMKACSFEGGTSAVKIDGAMIGLSVDACYFEAVQGEVFDLTDVTEMAWTVANCRINYVDTVIDDGGAGSTISALIGEWSASNIIQNVGGSSGGHTYPAEVIVSGQNNFTVFKFSDTTSAPTLPANWTVGKATRFEREATFGGVSLTDVRARGKFFGGVVPLTYQGDPGEGFAGLIPYSTYAIPSTNPAVASIATNLTWRVDTMIAAFRLTLVDNTATYKINGFIMGDTVHQLDTTGKTVTVSESFGKYVVSVAGVNNASGGSNLTGTVRMVG